jgi:hypothetical protein
MRPVIFPEDNMEKITNIKYIFDEKEKRILKKCLDYCYHRIHYHQESGISHILAPNDVLKINELRKDLE